MIDNAVLHNDDGTLVAPRDGAWIVGFHMQWSGNCERRLQYDAQFHGWFDEKGHRYCAPDLWRYDGQTEWLPFF